jgi:elongation factor Ts
MDVEKIKQLREETGAGVMDAKNALQETGGDIAKAKQFLMEKGMARAEKRSDRETSNGLIYTYVHGEGQIGVLMEINCETSFVAKTDEFRTLAHEIALQIASMSPETPEELVQQPYIRDSKTTIDEMIKAVVAKTGENITVSRFARYQLGQ